MRLTHLLLAAACVVLVSGCGGPDFGEPVSVTGKVMYKNQPVADAQVTFHNKAEKGGRSASGRTGTDGTFSLTTFDTDDGALPGDYVVTVSKVAGGDADSIDVEGGEFGADYGAMMDGASSGDPAKENLDNQLPEKYSKADESGIERTVASSPPNDFEIVLE